MTRTTVRLTRGLRKAERFPVSRKRKPGQPAHRRVGQTRLTANEKDYYDAVLQAWAEIPRSTIRTQFIAPFTQDGDAELRAVLTDWQGYLAEVTLFQLEQSGASIFNEIRALVAAAWAKLEKAETPSQFAAQLQFDRASPNATAYASLSAANMVTDMVDTQILAVRDIVTQAFRDGLTRGEVSSRLVTLLNKMPSPKILQPGMAGLASVFGDATRGLTQRYAMAVYHRAERLMADNPTMRAAELRRKVNAYGDRLKRSRARMIARTEIMRASNQGRLQGMWQAADQGLINPVTAKKQWVTSRFDVCHICVPLAGVSVGIRETFPTVNSQAPPAHPNCRCTVRELPDPLTFGEPRSVGTGMPGAPLRFVRPSRPGLQIEDLSTLGPGAVAEPGALIGQPAAESLSGLPSQGGIPGDPPLQVPTGDLFLSGQTYRVALEQTGDAAKASDALIRYKGFDARPRVVDFDDLGDLTEASPTGELRRLVGPVNTRDANGRFMELPPGEAARSYRNGELFIGEGVYGRGTYAIEGSADDAVQYFAGRQAARGPHEILEMTMDSDARVFDMPRNLWHRERPFSDSLHDLVGSDDAHDVLAALGYDAVRYGRDEVTDVRSSKTITVILNRGKVVVARTRGTKIDDVVPFPRKKPPVPEIAPATPQQTGNISELMNVEKSTSAKRTQAVIDPVLQAMDDAGLQGDTWVTGPTQITLRNKAKANADFSPYRDRPMPQYRDPAGAPRLNDYLDEHGRFNVGNPEYQADFAAWSEKKKKAQLAYEERLAEWQSAPLVSRISVRRGHPQLRDDYSVGSQQGSFSHEVGHRLDVTEIAEDIQLRDGRVRRKPVSYKYHSKETVRRVGELFPESFADDIDPLDLPEDLQSMWAFLSKARETPSLQHALQSSKTKARRDYLSAPHEIWARAFQQWFVKNHGSVEAVEDMLAQTTTRWTGFQWKPDEFDELDKLVEQVLRDTGRLA